MKKFLITALSVVVLGLLPLVFASAQAVPSTQELQVVIEQLQAKIAELQKQISELKVELSTTKEELQGAKEELVFLRTLQRGAFGEDVKQLQELLSRFEDVYPEGFVTGYFGALTEKAVQRWQEKQGIVNEGNPSTTGYGRVGPVTREKLNEFAKGGADQSGNTPS